MLDEIGAKSQSDPAHDGVGALETGLADCARRYTMQAERGVHDIVTKGAAGPTPVAVPAEAEEMGENVEFI
jgi:hypothetical protein